MSPLMYDCGDYAIEMFDVVEAPGIGEAVIVQLHPRKREVTIRYADHLAAYRTTCNPRIRKERLPISKVNLIRRDG